MAKNMICHVEWSTTNIEQTQTFLAGLFDWKFQSFGEEYALFKTPEGIGGGLMKVDAVQPGNSPTIYVEVDEIEPYVEKAKDLGGGVAVPKTEIPSMGWFAHLTAPDGNVVGLFQESQSCCPGCDCG